MNIKEQSISARVGVKRREFGRTSNAFVAPSIQQVCKQGGGDGDDPCSKRSHELDRSGDRVHFRIGRFVRVERDVDLSGRSDGRHRFPV